MYPQMYVTDKLGIQKLKNYIIIYANISFSQDLKDFMRQAGDVTYADAHKQRKNEG